MRGIVLPLLLPGTAFAQDVPSLQRPNPALPITESLDTLRSRLGRAGGNFAAAQLALKPGGEAVLQAAKDAKDPLVRLDAAYGLSLLDTRSAYLSLAYLLGDGDARVSGEAYVNLRRVRTRASNALREVAFRGNEQAGNSAIYLSDGPTSGTLVLEVAKTPAAAGRQAAIDRLYYAYASTVPVLEAAAHDPRLEVATAASRHLLYGRKTEARKAALNRLVNGSDVAPRLALAKALEADYSNDFWDVMVSLLSDPSPKVRLMLVDVLVDNLFSSGRVAASLPAIARLVDDPIREVGDRALKRLGEYAQDRIAQKESTGWATNRAAPKLRRGAVKRLTGPLAFYAATILALLQDRRAYPVLVQRTHGGGRPELAILALGMLRDRRATPYLRSLTADPVYGGNAFVALGYLRDPSTIPFLVNLVQTRPREEGIPAAYALAQIGDRSVTPKLLAVANDPNIEIGYRLNFVEPLVRLGGPGVRQLLIRFFETVIPQQLPQVANALITLKDPTVIPDLERFASSTDAARATEARRVIERLKART